MRDFIPIAKPIIGEEEIEAVGEVLRSGMLTQGEKVKRFEEEFSKYLDVQELHRRQQRHRRSGPGFERHWICSPATKSSHLRSPSSPLPTASFTRDANRSLQM